MFIYLLISLSTICIHTHRYPPKATAKRVGILRLQRVASWVLEQCDAAIRDVQIVLFSWIQHHEYV